MWKLALMLCCLGFGASAEQQRVLLGSRSYVIDLPANPSGAVIVALHNASGHPEEFRGKIRLSAPATAKGYAVIYPYGLGGSWNAFYCCGSAQVNRSADMRFLDLVIADAVARYGLSPGRVYLTGMGNGAIMAETYAARRAGAVKAVAGVAGTLDLRRSPAAAVPMLHVHGLEDTVVPYGLERPGFGSDREGPAFPAVPPVIAAFVAAHGGLAKSTRRFDKVNDGTSIIEDNYRNAAGRTQVRLITIVGGQHVWPAPQRRGKGNTQDIGATTEVLRFFGEHP